MAPLFRIYGTLLTPLPPIPPDRSADTERRGGRGQRGGNGGGGGGGAQEGLKSQTVFVRILDGDEEGAAPSCSNPPSSATSD
jgi:hypothetical protein